MKNGICSCNARTAMRSALGNKRDGRLVEHSAPLSVLSGSKNNRFNGYTGPRSAPSLNAYLGRAARSGAPLYCNKACQRRTAYTAHLASSKRTNGVSHLLHMKRQRYS